MKKWQKRKKIVEKELGFLLIMVLSASSATSLAESGNSYKYFKKQLIAAAVGIVGLIVLSNFDYRLYRRIKWPMYIIMVGILIAVKFVGMSSRTALKDGLILQDLTFSHQKLQNSC